jgi:Heterokaryon incompatibility protein (HET)
MLTEFNYRPLGKDEIRLVRLSTKSTKAASSYGHVGRDAGNEDTADQLLHCQLQHFGRSDRPKYIALSYAWGTQSSEKKIYMDDQTCSISLTVEQALRLLQSESPEVFVWVDQICINQADDVEKNHQVGQMKLIYCEAVEVVAWLGPDAAECSVLFPYLQQSLTAYTAKDYETLFSLYGDEQRRSTISRAWRRFCERNYWTRLWIIQEYAVASKIRVAGGAAIVSNVVTTHPLVLIQHLETNTIEIPEGFQRQQMRDDITNTYHIPAISFMSSVVTRRQRYYYNRDKGEDVLFRVVVTALALEVDYNQPLSTDPRDRIFALVHLADDAADFKTFPDYRKSCEVIYAEMAQIMLEQGYFDLLSYCQFPKRLPNLPSWAPDWSMELRTPCASSPWINRFSASGNTKKRQRLSIVDPNTISLWGFIVDSVDETGILWDPNWLKPVDAYVAMAYLSQIFGFCRKSPRISEHNELHTTARIAIQDAPRRTESYPNWPDAVLRDYFEAILIFVKQIPVNAQSTEDTLDLQAHLYIRLLRALHSRRSFISSTGYVGLCPHQSRPGDQICIFFGSKIPYIVRPLSGGFFELIGEAYVHDIMQGELSHESVDEIEFVIR